MFVRYAGNALNVLDMSKVGGTDTSLLQRRGVFVRKDKKKAPTSSPPAQVAYQYRHRHATVSLQEATRREPVKSYQVTLRSVTPPQYSLASVFCSTDNIMISRFFVYKKISLFFSVCPNFLGKRLNMKSVIF